MRFLLPEKTSSLRSGAANRAAAWCAHPRQNPANPAFSALDCNVPALHAAIGSPAVSAETRSALRRIPARPQLPPSGAGQAGTRANLGTSAQAAGLLEVSFENAHEYGVDPAALVDDDYARCQEFAAELRTANVPGIIVPNAALPGTRNVVLFGPRDGSPYELDPVSPVDIPASITAHAGSPDPQPARPGPLPRRPTRGSRGTRTRRSLRVR